MPTLTVTFKETITAEHQIEAGKSLTIGRKPENDVVIDNLAVSGHHAKIDTIGDALFLMDLQSKNGTFVNERKISSHRLADGDVIAIGKHLLIFSYAEGESRTDAAAADIDKTMVMDTNQYRDMLQKSELQSKGAGNNIVAALSFLVGGSGEVGISKKLFKIGKNAQNDIQVGGLWVGQTAVTISQRPGGYYLSYVEGMAKPKVNGNTVKDSVLLKEFDIIEIGKAKMQIIFKTKAKEK